MTKRKSTKNSSPSEPKELVSKEDVYNVLEFAQAAYNVFGGVYSPDLVGSRLRDITLNPQVATADKIDQALLEPKDSEQQLIGYSEYLDLTSMIYRRVLLYFSGLMSFDWNYICTNIKDPKEYNSPAYKKDLDAVRQFFNRFNVKDSFKVAMREMLRNEAYFGILRDDGEKYVIQELPQLYSKITGRFDYGLLFDFNMYW